MKELTQLQTGKRYTIVRQGSMGFVYSEHIELVEVTNEPWAQYQETIRLIYKLKGKRNLRQTRFCPRDSYLVWEGWLSVNTDIFVETTEENGFIVRKSLGSCDREYFERAKRSVNTSPFIECKAH